MKNKLLALVLVLSFTLFFNNTPASSSERTSPDPTDISLLQCHMFPNYGIQINFEGYTPGTEINTQYLLTLGVRFGAAAGGPTTEANTDASRPNDGNVLGGRPIYLGNVYASFWIGQKKAYVCSVGATVGWCNEVGKCTMKAYDCSGTPVATYTNKQIGVEFFSVSAPEIHKVIFFAGQDTAGVSIDCFTYYELEPCLSKIPTLSQWGLLILTILVVGSGVWLMLKRRRAVRV